MHASSFGQSRNFAARAGSFGARSGSFGARPGNFAARPGNFAARPGNFAARAGNFAGRSGNFAGRYGNLAGRSGNFAGRYGNLAGRYGNGFGQHAWDNYFRNGGWNGNGWNGNGWYGNGWYGNGWYGNGWYGGGYWPAYGGWGLGWGYPYNYGYYYPGANDYYYSYAPTYYGGDSDNYASAGYGDYVNPYAATTYDYNPYATATYGDTGIAAGPAEAIPQQPQAAAEMTPPTAADQPAATALEYYSEARVAFLQGDYRNTLRLAGHAGVEAPQNPRVHELISLALFALGNYEPAAGEAHAAMALGPIPAWKDLVGYYYDAEKQTAQLGALEVQKYTTQLRALEKAVAGNPQSAAEHFLLGYHYLMINARDHAKTQFAAAVKLTPGDKLASHFLQELQSNSPLTRPPMAPALQGKSL